MKISKLNPAVSILNIPTAEREKIRARHAKMEEQVRSYVACKIPPIDDATLKEFAFKYITDSNREDNFLGSMLQVAEDIGNARLYEAVIFVVEYVCLNTVFLGEACAKRPDAFSYEFIQAMNSNDYDRRNEQLLRFGSRRT